MIQTEHGTAYDIRFLRKDVGVALVVAAALALGLVLRMQTVSRATAFQDKDTGFRIAYPATWGTVDLAPEALLLVQDPQADSAFKTTLTVEVRDLDPSSPPTLQDLVDRRVAERGALTGYHFLANEPAAVGGAKAMRIEYAYTVQPIDQPRRASLPVVVRALEYVALGTASVYYVTVAAPASEQDVRGLTERIINTVVIP